MAKNTTATQKTATQKTATQKTATQKTATQKTATQKTATSEKVQAVKFVFGTILKDGKELQTCKAVTVEMDAPKCYIAGAEATKALQAFVYHDVRGRLDDQKTALTKVVNSEDADKDDKATAKARLEVVNAKIDALTKACEKTKVARQLPKNGVKDFPVSRILASVLTGEKLPIEYGDANKALKACDKVYNDVTEGECRKMTDDEKIVIKACKDAIVKAASVLLSPAKDSKGFVVRLKNEDVRNLWRVGGRMSKTGVVNLSKNTLEACFMRQLYGRMLTEEQQAAAKEAAKEAEKEEKEAKQA